SGATGRSLLGHRGRERAWVVAPRSQRNPNSCWGITARILQGRDGLGPGRNQPMDSTTEPTTAGAAAVFVGIDVSKTRLDVALRLGAESWGNAHDEAGVAELVDRLRPLAGGGGPALIVLEATGGLERLVVAALALAGLPVAVVNPRQVREVAKATGRLA